MKRTEIEQLRPLWQKGLSIKEIAEKFQTPEHIMLQRMQKLGIFPRRPSVLGEKPHNKERKRYTVGGGYIQVYIRREDYPFIPDDYDAPAYPEHRLMMAKHIGRPLLSCEEIHHIDGIRDHNVFENLLLANNKKEHAKLDKERRRDERARRKAED